MLFSNCLQLAERSNKSRVILNRYYNLRSGQFNRKKTLPNTCFSKIKIPRIEFPANIQNAFNALLRPKGMAWYRQNSNFPPTPIRSYRGLRPILAAIGRYLNYWLNAVAEPAMSGRWAHANYRRGRPRVYSARWLKAAGLLNLRFE